MVRTAIGGSPIIHSIPLLDDGQYGAVVRSLMPLRSQMSRISRIGDSRMLPVVVSRILFPATAFFLANVLLTAGLQMATPFPYL